MSMCFGLGSEGMEFFLAVRLILLYNLKDLSLSLAGEICRGGGEATLTVKACLSTSDPLEKSFSSIGRALASIDSELILGKLPVLKATALSANLARSCLLFSTAGALLSNQVLFLTSSFLVNYVWLNCEFLYSLKSTPLWVGIPAPKAW